MTARPPTWIVNLLRTAADRVAQASSLDEHVRFQASRPDTAPGGSLVFTAEVFLRSDPASASIAVYVVNADSGRLVCRGDDALLDVLDQSTWNEEIQ